MFPLSPSLIEIEITQVAIKQDATYAVEDGESLFFILLVRPRNELTSLREDMIHSIGEWLGEPQERLVVEFDSCKNNNNYNKIKITNSFIYIYI